MPGLVKIGFTTGSIERRISELRSTGVPSVFTLAAAYLVNNPDECENKIHSILAAYRHDSQREFFSISVTEALNKAFLVILEFITTEDDPLSQVDAQPLICVIDDHILCCLYHNADLQSPAELAEYTHFSVTDILRALYKLAERGFVIESAKPGTFHSRSYFSITPKGRKFSFENDIALKDLIEESDKK